MAAHLAHHGIERHELVHGRQALRLGGRGRMLGRRAPLGRAPQREQAGQQPERRVSLPLPPRVQLSARGSPASPGRHGRPHRRPFDTQLRTCLRATAPPCVPWVRLHLQDGHEAGAVRTRLIENPTTYPNPLGGARRDTYRLGCEQEANARDGIAGPAAGGPAAPPSSSRAGPALAPSSRPRAMFTTERLAARQTRPQGLQCARHRRARARPLVAAEGCARAAGAHRSINDERDRRLLAAPGCRKP